MQIKETAIIQLAEFTLYLNFICLCIINWIEMLYIYFPGSQWGENLHCQSLRYAFDIQTDYENENIVHWKYLVYWFCVVCCSGCSVAKIYGPARCSWGSSLSRDPNIHCYCTVSPTFITIRSFQNVSRDMNRFIRKQKAWWLDVVVQLQSLVLIRSSGSVQSKPYSYTLFPLKIKNITRIKEYVWFVLKYCTSVQFKLLTSADCRDQDWVFIVKPRVQHK